MKKDILLEDHLEGEDLKIPVNNKRIIAEQGAFIVADNGDDKNSEDWKEPVKTPTDIELEARLQAEIERL